MRRSKVWTFRTNAASDLKQSITGYEQNLISEHNRKILLKHRGACLVAKGAVDSDRHAYATAPELTLFRCATPLLQPRSGTYPFLQPAQQQNAISRHSRGCDSPLCCGSAVTG